MEEDIIVKLKDGRKIVTTNNELDRIILALRERVVKFSDVPKLLTEHSYLFINCDPIWNRQFEWNRNTTTTMNTPTTIL